MNKKDRGPLSRVVGLTGASSHWLRTGPTCKINVIGQTSTLASGTSSVMGVGLSSSDGDRLKALRKEMVGTLRGIVNWDADEDKPSLH